jgi:hypothetical protein
MLCSKKLYPGSCLFLLIGMCLTPRSASAEGYEFIPPPPALEAPSAEAEMRTFPPQIAALPDVTAKLRVVRRCSQFMVTRSPISRTFVADPRIVDIVEFSDNEVSFVGLEQGTTTATLWFHEGQEPLILQVEVTPSIGVAKSAGGSRELVNRGTRRGDHARIAAVFGPSAGHAPSLSKPSSSPNSPSPGMLTAERKPAQMAAPIPRYDGHTPWQVPERAGTRGAVPAVFERSRQAPQQADFQR